MRLVKFRSLFYPLPNCLTHLFSSLRCAELAKQNGYRYFGLQFYGECWSGVHSSALFNSSMSDKCWGHRPDYKNCDDNSLTECIGQEHYNYIYEVKPGGRSLFPDPTRLALKKIFG